MEQPGLKTVKFPLCPPPPAPLLLPPPSPPPAPPLLPSSCPPAEGMLDSLRLIRPAWRGGGSQTLGSPSPRAEGAGAEEGCAAVRGGSSNFTAQGGGGTARWEPGASPRHVCHHSRSAEDGRRRCLQEGKGRPAQHAQQGVEGVEGVGGVSLLSLTAKSAGRFRSGQEGRQQVQNSLSGDPNVHVFPI